MNKIKGLLNRCMQKISVRSFLVIGTLILLIINVNPVTSSFQKTAFNDNYYKNVYYTYDGLTDLLYELKQEYPDIFNFSSLGTTWEGRDIWLVKISDNVSLDEGEPSVLYTGGIHGNEDPGYQVVIYSLKAIVENYTYPYVNESFTNRIKSAVNSTELYFIPMLNPDGIESHVRKNRKPTQGFFGMTLLSKKFWGIDLHHNFDFNWDDVYEHPFKYIKIPRSLRDLISLIKDKNSWIGERTAIVNPRSDLLSLIGSGMYRGPYAFSEEETQAVKSFVENHTISIHLDYHIPGEFIYCSGLKDYNNPSDKITILSIANNMSKINGYRSPTGEVKAFKWLNYSGAFGQWMYKVQNVYSFGIELCVSMEQGLSPDKAYINEVWYTHLLVNLYLAERVQEIDI